jgi:hypothetical protein
MSVEHGDRIDMIGIDATTGDVVLTIADHLDWSDEYGHLAALQKKLNAYLSVIESGEIVEQYPNASGRRPVIDLVFKHDPTPTATEFLRRASPTITSIGAELRSRVKR